MSFTFVANLKPYTFHRGRGVRRFDAYLLSVDYMRPETRRLARKTLLEERHLCADNGNVDAIRGLIRRFDGEARALDRRRKVEEDALGRYARPGELSKSLVEAYRSLSFAIRDASASIARPDFVRSAVAAQRDMGATYAIGMEDFTIATMTGLSIEPEYAVHPSAFYAELNERAARFGTDTRAGLYGSPPRRVFGGVHAMNFDQARDAGFAVGSVGLAGIATGLVGALRDRNSTDYRIENGSHIDLGGTVARPYLRVVEIVAGLHLGFHDATGRSPDFHALGAGTPILLPLLGLLSRPNGYTATDSTAPIVDGWSGPTVSLYVDEPAPLKLRAEKIAEHWIRGGRGWDCRCCYCENFTERHPPQLDVARRWWKGAGEPAVDKGMLSRSGALATAFPYLGHHPDPEIRREAGLARVGHNHGVIQRLERVIRDAVAENRIAIIDAMIEAYLLHAGSRRWRAAVREAHALARRTRVELGLET